MCGRLTLFSSSADIARAFALEHAPPELHAHYNLAPTQRVGAIRHDREKHRRFSLVRWGLVPSWSKDLSMGARLINARAETLLSKPSFRDAYRRRRCIVVADGFYEWKRKGKLKQPYFIHRHDRRPLAFAGLWERWSKGPTPIDSCTLITTTPNALVAQLHHRMPVILHPEDFDRWLDRDTPNPRELSALLIPCDADLLDLHAVSTHVNRVQNDDPTCIVELNAA